MHQDLSVNFAYHIYDLEKVNELKEGVRNITTDATGTATLKVFPKREGDYLIRVTGRDRAGRTSMQSTSVMDLGGRRQTVKAAATYRWLRADCGTVEPFAPAKALQAR